MITQAHLAELFPGIPVGHRYDVRRINIPLRKEILEAGEEPVLNLVEQWVLDLEKRGFSVRSLDVGGSRTGEQEFISVSAVVKRKDEEPQKDH